MKVKLLSGALGAEIFGVDLSKNLERAHVRHRRTGTCEEEVVVPHRR